MPGLRFRVVLPFDLAIPAGLGVVLLRNERRFGIACQRLEGERLSSYTAPNRDWLVMESIAQLRLTARADDGRERVIREFRYDARQGLVSGGIIDFQPFTVVDVFIERPEEFAGDIEPTARAFLGIVEEAIRDFVTLYGIVTSASDVFPPILADLAAVEIAVSDDFRFTGDGWEGRFREGSKSIQWQPKGPNPMFKRLLADGEIQVLRKLARSQEYPRLVDYLFLAAKHHAYVYHDYCVSIILSCTAFEVGIKTSLLGACQRLGIRSLKSKGRGHERLAAKAIDDGNIRSELLAFASQIVGENVKAAQQYQTWYEMAYLPRIRIVHSGLRDCRDEDARNAFDACTSYLKLIEAKLLATQTYNKTGEAAGVCKRLKRIGRLFFGRLLRR